MISFEMKEGFSLGSSLLFESLFGNLESTSRLTSSSPGETENARGFVWLFALVFFFFVLSYCREDYLIIMNSICICVIIVFGVFLLNPWIHQQLFVGRLAGNTSAKQLGGVANMDLSHALYKNISTTIHKMKMYSDQPLFRAVAHWIVSIRMTHGQLYILYLCSDWMLGWGEEGEDSE